MGKEKGIRVEMHAFEQGIWRKGSAFIAVLHLVHLPRGSVKNILKHKGSTWLDHIGKGNMFTLCPHLKRLLDVCGYTARYFKNPSYGMVRVVISGKTGWYYNYGGIQSLKLVPKSEIVRADGQLMAGWEEWTMVQTAKHLAPLNPLDGKQP